METASITSLRLFIVKRCHPIQQKVCEKALNLLLLFLIVFYPVNSHGEKFKAASDIWTPFFLVSQNQFSGISFISLNDSIK